MNCRTLWSRSALLLVGMAGMMSLGAMFTAPYKAEAQGAPAAPAGPPPTAEQIAPQDFTGYWVSVVTEDWRYRMVTAAKGDFTSVPLNPEGRKVADMWDQAKDIADHEACRAYGAAAIMRMPERLHITWANPNTLEVQTDAGEQTRLFHFNETMAPPNTPPSWQGYSVASWQGLRPRGPGNVGAINAGARGNGPQPEGYLQVNTTHLRPGYLRKNGVPYSKDATVEEFFDGFKEPNGDQWLVVTTIVTDPTYLMQPFIVSSQFKKTPGNIGWHPTTCEQGLKESIQARDQH